jgi:hypothetical protein
MGEGTRGTATASAAFQTVACWKDPCILSVATAVAYVKFDKASSAALAIESLNGAVLNNGRGPKLKVLLAEAPTAR